MPDPDLTLDERQVLEALIEPTPNAKVDERTVAAVAKRTGLSEQRVVAALRALDEKKAEVVHRNVDATTGDEFWIAFPEATEQLEPPTA